MRPPPRAASPGRWRAAERRCRTGSNSRSSGVALLPGEAKLLHRSPREAVDALCSDAEVLAAPVVSKSAGESVADKPPDERRRGHPLKAARPGAEPDVVVRRAADRERGDEKVVKDLVLTFFGDVAQGQSSELSRTRDALVEQVLQREVVGHGCRWVELNDCQNLRQQAEARLRKMLTKTERIHSSAASSS